MGRRRARREQRHAARPGRPARWLSWLPEVLIVLVVLAAFGNVEYDLGHRWFGLATNSPRTPAAVLPPEGLDLPAGTTAPAVAEAVAGTTLDATAVKAALARYAGDARFGPHLAFRVADLSTGRVVFRRGADAVVPASTTKLLTAAAALESLEPQSRFVTRVVASGKRIVLVGGGDPYLASTTAKGRNEYPVRADLTTLAKRAAVALRSRGLTSVVLTYDDGLFTGPAVNPRWPANYRPDDVVPPITALWVDQGKGPDGRYDAAPATAAAKRFAVALRKHGLTVAGTRSGTAPVGADEIASVSSAPVGEIVQQMLAVSDNNAAEVLARHVAIAEGQPASFVGGSAAILQVLRGLDVETAGSTLYDGSGLSRENELTAELLVDVLTTAASPANPRLREVITGLPVAGFTGSLQDRFDTGAAEGRGRVRAKTGTLTGVHGLAGVAAGPDGSLLAFVLVADRVAGPNTLPVRRLLDQMAAALGACRCGSVPAASPGPGTAVGEAS